MLGVDSLVKKIDCIMAKDYNHEVPDVLRSRDFNRLITKFIKDAFNDYEVFASNGNFCTASGFIKNNDGKFVYYSFEDYRYGDYKKCILIRTAENEKDYTGGSNNFTDLSEFVFEVEKLFRRGF